VWLIATARGGGGVGVQNNIPQLLEIDVEDNIPQLLEIDVEDNIPQLLEIDVEAASSGRGVAAGSVRVLPLPGVDSPHSLAVTDSRGQGCAHEGGCVYVGETRLAGSQLHQLPLGSRRS
jgi:hypothetical protein